MSVGGHTYTHTCAYMHMCEYTRDVRVCVLTTRHRYARKNEFDVSKSIRPSVYICILADSPLAGSSFAANECFRVKGICLMRNYSDWRKKNANFLENPVFFLKQTSKHCYEDPSAIYVY